MECLSPKFHQKNHPARLLINLVASALSNAHKTQIQLLLIEVLLAEYFAFVEVTYESSFSVFAHPPETQHKVLLLNTKLLCDLKKDFPLHHAFSVDHESPLNNLKFDSPMSD